MWHSTNVLQSICFLRGGRTMNDLTLFVVGGIALILALLVLAYFIWPTNRDDEIPRRTTSSKNSRGYWE